jgi:hypothetical protein
MAERIIGSLIHGEHVTPVSRTFRQRFLLPLIVAAVFLLIGALVYTFYNYREEQTVAAFLDEVFSGQMEAAFARWDTAGSSYTLQDFLNDWGPDGYYTKGMARADIIDSNRKGHSVIVYVQMDPARRPVALLVEKESQKLTFSPTTKY